MAEWRGRNFHLKMEKQNKPEFGPRQIDVYTVSLRSLLAFVGGLGGGVLLILVYLFQGQAQFYQTDGPMALLFFLIGSLVFTLAANLPSVWLQMGADREKFHQAKMDHFRRVFAVNVAVWILFALVYFWAFLFDPAMMSGIFLMQFFISAVFSVLALDVLAGFRFAYQGIFGTLFGLFLGVILVGALWSASFFIFALLGLPLLWFSLALGNGIMEGISHQAYSLYGISLMDAKNTSKKRGFGSGFGE